MRTLKTIRGTEYENSKTQDFTSAMIKSLVRDNPILNSNVVTAKIETSDTSVFHGLGRKITGWLVIGKNGNVDFWESTTVNENREREVILQSSAGGSTATFLFF